MNFFEQQDIARRNARLLTMLFLVAVFTLIVLTNAAVALFMWFGHDYNVYSGSREGMSGFLSYFSWARFGGIGMGVSSTVALVVLVKWFQLSTGGKQVAESMGGTRILPQADDPGERRVLNVVQELSLAANMPVPPVYVMNDERGINAFAAGITPADAVVAVTRGTIEQLGRDELQGVIAHEFSHILNGDMRLNIRLAAMLKGITFIGDVGYFLLHSSHRRRGTSRKNESALPLLGLGLLCVGWLGGMAAGFIKAAISRQKEYLADASAVQFTRNPEGIANALKVIGGYIPGTLVHAARAVEMSHIFFGQVRHHLWQVFATHPPIEERIRRLDPRWGGKFIERKVKHYETKTRAQGGGRAAIVGAAILASTSVANEALEEAMAEQDADFGPSPDALDVLSAKNHELPLAFVQHSHEPLGANALVFALLISRDRELQKKQLSIIAENNIAGLVDLVFTLAPGIQALHAPLRLPLLEMCLPGLKSISEPQYRIFKNTLLRIVRADGHTDLYEWCIFQLVRHYLDPEFFKVTASRPRYRRLHKVAYHVRVVMSMLAHESGGDTQAVFRIAADELGFTALQILPSEVCNVEIFSKAVGELADCYPLLKPRLLKAMALAAGLDGKTSGVEQEIIASVAAVMDCPVPYGSIGTNLSLLQE